MPIALSRNEFNRLKKWTDTDKEDPDTFRRREYLKYLNEESTKMTKSWPNSVENVNKRNEELRRARIEIAEHANNRFYKMYVKRQQAEQVRLMHSARDSVFKNKDAPKLLLSAVIETAIQKELGEQVKFNEARRREAQEEKRRNDDEITRNAKEWNELMEKKKKTRWEVNKKNQKEIVDQAQEIAERARIDFETELDQQKMDNLQAAEQIKAIKKFEIKFKAEEKARIWRDMNRAREQTEQLHKESRTRDKMDDQLQEVLNRTQARVDRRRKQTEKETKEAQLRVLEAISKKLESGDAALQAKEQASLEKATKEKQDQEESRRVAKENKLEQFRQDRRDARAQWERGEAERLHQINTMRQWSIMNRFKNAEIYDAYKEQNRLEKERKINEHREDLLKLWKERDDRDARAKAESRYFYGELAEKKIRDADNKLLTHAQLLLDEVRQHKRPEHAMLKAIDRYCKLNRLYPMPDLPRSMKEHFKRYAPKDQSAPDPWYAEPPPPDMGPDAPDQLDQPDQPDPPAAPASPPPASADKAKRDGMQPQPQAGPSKPGAPEHVPASEADYKRHGRANGMQRRNAMEDLVLPPISVVPCPNTECVCELRRK